jgi:hypothetical protein
MRRLTTETIEGTALSLEGIDNVEGSNGLALSVFSIGNSVTDNALEEGLQNTTSLLVDHSTDTLDTTTTSETADSWLCDALDVITKNLAVTLGSALAKTLSTFSASSHDEVV